MSTATLEDVRSASLEELAELWAGEDEDDRAAALAEAARRDRAERRQRARDAERAEWEIDAPWRPASQRQLSAQPERAYARADRRGTTRKSQRELAADPDLSLRCPGGPGEPG